MNHRALLNKGKKPIRNRLRIPLCLLCAFVLMVAAVPVGIQAMRCILHPHILVRVYDEERMTQVLSHAKDAFEAQQNQYMDLAKCLDVARNGFATIFFSSLHEAEETCLRMKNDIVHREGFYLVGQMCRSGDISPWSRTALDYASYVELLERGSKRAEYYLSHVTMFDHLMKQEDPAAEKYLNLFSAVLEADMDCTASLYQLVYRSLADHEHIINGGWIPVFLLNEYQEEMEAEIVVSSGALYQRRVETLLKAEYELDAFYDTLPKPEKILLISDGSDMKIQPTPTPLPPYWMQ